MLVLAFMYIADMLRENGSKTAVKKGPAYANTCAFLLLYEQALLIPRDSRRGKYAGLGPRMMQFCPYFTPVEGPNLACLKSSGDSPLTSAGGISGP